MQNHGCPTPPPLRAEAESGQQTVFLAQGQKPPEHVRNLRKPNWYGVAWYGVIHILGTAQMPLASCTWHEEDLCVTVLKVTLAWMEGRGAREKLLLG